jgi:hypothetical protein
VIQSIADQPVLDVSAQQRTVEQKVEEDSPTGDLGVMIATRVILPAVVVLETACPRDERIDEKFRSEHYAVPCESTEG